ncbi:MAG: ImmA/IrrE family metallo-endopeptidase [Desulfobacterales bacterium]|jgi:HTH-type transcriptional regulator/antitoxin HigA|nr:ImmA/IrrE family metallo-endopeptidase [Desulfobacterales bacterium]
MIRLIKTKKDYDLALSRIDKLMDAKQGTLEADELELLAALVEMYEEEHYPMDMPDPVEAIRFRMDQLGLNQQDIVPFIGSRSKVSEILNRKRTLNLAMIRSLHKRLGIPADILLGGTGAKFPDEVSGLQWKRFPLAEMVKRGWIKKKNDIKNHAEEVLQAFIKNANRQKLVSDALFRKSAGPRENSKTDHYALYAWCLRLITLARENPLPTKYKADTINEDFLHEVARLSYFDNGPLLAKEYLAKHGIYLIVLPHLQKTYLDGATLLLDDGSPVIGLTLRYDRLDNFWFSLLHELAHAMKHLSQNSGEIFIDDFDLRGHETEVADQRETEADELAKNAMIPENIWENDLVRQKATVSNLIALSKKIKIHPAIIAGRIRFEKKNYKLLSKYVGNREVRKHFKEAL